MAPPSKTLPSPSSTTNRFTSLLLDDDDDDDVTNTHDPDLNVQSNTTTTTTTTTSTTTTTTTNHPEPPPDDDSFTTVYSKKNRKTQTTPKTQKTKITKQDTFEFPALADILGLNKPETHRNLPTMAKIGLTENLSATYLSTANPCLDFFFHVVPDTSPISLIQRLSLAWAHDPLTTLKLMCNLRGVRGTGKSDKTRFYFAAFWLHYRHPKTLACNLSSFVEFGYFKDLPEILVWILGLKHIIRMSIRRRRRRRRICRLRTSTRTLKLYSTIRTSQLRKLRFGKTKRRARFYKKDDSKMIDSKEVRMRESLVRQRNEKIEAIEIRHQKRDVLAKRAKQHYNSDPNYRFLYDRVSDLFADHLKSDLESLKSGKLNKISLAAKWCPSLNSSYDRSTLLCEAIARKVFPKDEYEEYSKIKDAHYAYRVRDRLRKEVLVPLRKALQLPEVYMGANRWSELPYRRVPSVAMKNYNDLFVEHDGERFKEYLEKVKSGDEKIAAGALLPHEITAPLYSGDGGGGGGDEVAELQWKRMVEDMSKVGKLKNCIAVCDVSGSMEGRPMEVCIALGLLLSELSDEPWKGKVITFSEEPQLHLIQGDDLRSKTEFVREMDWGANTDFQKVFDQILKVAVEGGLDGDEMVKTVFVFSDMEFDQASENPWETDYVVIRRKFEEKGYGDNVPEIVFWNLRASRATPVPAKQKGVALVSGFSKNMMKVFMKGDDLDQFQIDPVAVMEKAICGEEYTKLAIYD